MLRSLFLALFLVSLAAPAAAQTGDDPMVAGILAFREARYEDAVNAFEQALEQDPANAEAHFLLARVFFETPLKDVDRAGDELDAALEIEPDNVQYMVALLQQLRTDSVNFLTDRIREEKRRDLAADILELDPTNAFAHEEFGILYIQDFWRFRNALMFPNVEFNQYGYRNRTVLDPTANYLERQLEELREQDPSIVPESPIEASQPVATALLDPNSVFLADKFDVETLRRQGIPATDLSGRAQRAYDRAVGHLYAALETDPRHRAVYDYLMEIYALKGEWTEALEMLQQMYVYFPDDTDLWTYLGLAHYRGGNPDAAAKAFESSFKFMTPEEQTAYSLLDFLVPREDRDLYAADPSAYTSQFWTSKDPRFLTPFNERRLEHYSRLTYADLLYASEALSLRGWQTERGQILVRYGVPNGDVVIIPRSTSDIRSASPAMAEGTQESGGGVSSALRTGLSGSGFDMLEEANTYNIWDYGDFKFVFEDPFRNGEYRMYSPSANDLAEGALPWINDYSILAGETFREYPERYEYEAPGRQVELPYLVAAFKGQAGQTDLFVNYGVPITDFGGPGEIINITANSGTFVIGRDRSILAERRRTIYGLRTDQIVSFDEQNLWIDSEILTVPPGQADVSVEFETTSGGTVAVQRRSVDIADFSGTGLALSDLLLAYRVEETDDGRPLAASDVVRKGLSITPAPWSVFGTEQPIYLYFEVYGLEQGGDGNAQYEIEAALVPREEGSRVGKFVRGIFGGGAQGVSVRVPVTVAASDDGQYLIMDATSQEAGLYTLQLRVRDQLSGRTVDAEQELFLE